MRLVSSWLATTLPIIGPNKVNKVESEKNQQKLLSFKLFGRALRFFQAVPTIAWHQMCPGSKKAAKGRRGLEDLSCRRIKRRQF